MKKILIYGFRPYLKYKQNISELIIKNLSKKNYLKTKIFPVTYQKNIYLKPFKEDFSIILGIGQHPRSKKIRIERKAFNPKNKKSFLFTSLRLKTDKTSYYSYHAGFYVCNFTMYLYLSNIKTKNIPFAFIHIPKKYSIPKAINFVENKLNEVKAIY